MLITFQNVHSLRASNRLDKIKIQVPRVTGGYP